MARNAGGAYSLPLGPVVTGTTILSAWANTTLNDLAPELTDSLSRSGKGGMQAPLGLMDGTLGAPGLAFNLELSTGLRRAAANDFRLVVAGADKITQTPTLTTLAVDTTVGGVLTSTGVLKATAGLKSDLAAASGSTDFLHNTLNTRTAGLLLDVQNNAVSQFSVDPTGITSVAGVLKPLAGLRSDLAAGSTSTDFLHNTLNTRTAGLLLDIQNNTASKFSVDPAGITSVAGVLKPLAGLKSDLAAASGSTDFVLNTLNTRTAGLLFAVQNNAGNRVSVNPDGLLVHGLGLVPTAGTAPVRVIITADVTCSSSTVAVNLGPAISVKSGKTYRISGHFRALAAATTTGVNYGIKQTGSPTRSLSFMSVQHWGSSGALLSYATAFSDTPGIGFTSTRLTFDGDWDYFYSVFTTTGTGTIQLLLISSVNLSAVTVGAGSWFEISED